jgi:hypothetical protein
MSVLRINLGRLLSTFTLCQLVLGFSHTTHSYLGGVLEDYLRNNSLRTLESIRDNIQGISLSDASIWADKIQMV